LNINILYVLAILFLDIYTMHTYIKKTCIRMSIAELFVIA